jgi:hypothetical protein
MENNRSFTSIHDRHVRREAIDCGSCHNFSRTVAACPADLTGDGLVNFADLAALRADFGNACP